MTSDDVRAKLSELVLRTAEAGERELPSLRELSARFGVAPNTIKKTLLELQGDIRVVPVHGRGFFLQFPGDPEPVSSSHVDEEFVDSEPQLEEVRMRIPVDLQYSPVPEEGRALKREGAARRDSILVVGQLLRATDPTGAPGTRFQLFLHTRQVLQNMGYQLSWAPLGYDKEGRLPASEAKSFELQMAAVGDRLAGILLLDPGYGRDQPLWDLVASATDRPVVWFHSAPLDTQLLPSLPSNAHILEPEWHKVGLQLAEYLLEHYHPQKLVLLPAPGEKELPPHLFALRERLIKEWGPRWVSVLDWYDVFPEGLPKGGRIHRAMLNTGLVPYELDRFFRAARSLRASLWVCADDLLALAALDHFQGQLGPNEPRPGVLGFGNHPFSLAHGLSTVDFSWPTWIERAVELFTGYGRRHRQARYIVVSAPSDSRYGGNLLATRDEEW